MLPSSNAPAVLWASKKMLPIWNPPNLLKACDQNACRVFNFLPNPNSHRDDELWSEKAATTTIGRCKITQQTMQQHLPSLPWDNNHHHHHLLLSINDKNYYWSKVGKANFILTYPTQSCHSVHCLLCYYNKTKISLFNLPSFIFFSSSTLRFFKILHVPSPVPRRKLDRLTDPKTSQPLLSCANWWPWV